MSEDKKLFEWIESKVNIKKLLFAILTLLVGGGAGLGIEHTIIGDKIGEFVKPSIDKAIQEELDGKVQSLINKKVYSVLDSTTKAMNAARLPRLEEMLSVELKIDRDSVASVLARWFKREDGIFFIGLFNDGGRVKYRDIDGEVYIPSYDDSIGKYFFFHPIEQQTFWCH